MLPQSLVLLVVVASMQPDTVIGTGVSSITEIIRVAAGQVVTQFELVIEVGPVDWKVSIPALFLFCLEARQDGARTRLANPRVSAAASDRLTARLTRAL